MSCVTKRIVIAELLAHAQHEVLEVAARLRVDRRERLVHQQDRRLVGERARDRDALLHAAGQLPRVVVDEARQPDGLDRVLDEPRPLGAREPLVPQRQQHVVPHRRPRHQRAAVLLEDERHLLGRRRSRACRAAAPRRCVGRSRPPMHLSSVVLPQPDGPTTQTNSPSSTVKVTSPTACVAFGAAAVGLAEVLDLEHRRRSSLRGGRAPAAVPGEHAPLDEQEERGSGGTRARRSAGSPPTSARAGKCSSRSAGRSRRRSCSRSTRSAPS